MNASSSPTPQLTRIICRGGAILLLAVLAPNGVHGGPPFAQFVDPHPSAGNQFGASVVALSTGNVVVTAPFDDTNGTDTGAVYLFNGATGALISEIHGSTVNDQVGVGGLTALANGNFVARSQFWDNGAAANAGAVTWGSGTTGVSGVVSAGNSLVGTTANDGLGFVVALTNGHYVVRTQTWDNGATTDVGAVTWCDGTTGRAGVVGTSNSLVGSTAGDQVGNSIVVLANSNYVVISSGWDNGAATNAGAVTWGSGTAGVSGAVNVSNSLVGSSADDGSGIFTVSALTNGNYVACAPSWDNGATTNVGAATWGSGTSGVSGAISISISLIGSTTGDAVGASCTVLTNGNYVVGASSWDNGAAANAGAATWCNGTTGLAGPVTSSNSLVGTTPSDQVAFNGNIIALSNGHYVVCSPFWDDGAMTNLGAVTWGDGTTGITGPVSTGNSLLGATTGDIIGNNGATALINGNYVVASTSWSNGAVSQAGAATWCNGAGPTTGVVSTANSIVGSNTNDHVSGTGSGGGANGITALTNGNYVVASSQWANGPSPLAGAVTFGNGTMGTAVTVSVANSLVGTSNSDLVGAVGSQSGVVPLANGNYVVRSTLWDNGAISNAGAATWGSGATGVSGAVSAGNSLVGTTANDQISQFGVTALPGGNYIVATFGWDNGATVNAGAVTWGDGATGISGPVSTSNSLSGGAANAGLQSVVADHVNGTFFGRFRDEAGGIVRLGSQADGLAPSPVIVSPTVSSLTSTSVTLGGNVSADNGFAITARGVVYALTTVNSAPKIGGGGVVVLNHGAASTGAFTLGITGLIPNTGYSFSAFATNSEGTTYTLPATAFTTPALSFLSDTDGDGINDASEFAMAALGFDWQVQQPALVNTLFSNANGAGLFTTSQVQALHAPAPLIQRNPATGVFMLTLGLQKSTTLAPAGFSHFPMNAPGASTAINGSGKLEFQFTVPDNTAFFRLSAQ